jgi:hypothetical protein
MSLSRAEATLLLLLLLPLLLLLLLLHTRPTRCIDVSALPTACLSLAFDSRTQCCRG